MLRMNLRPGKITARALPLALLAVPFFGLAARAVDQGSTQPTGVHHKTRKKALPPLVLPPLPAGPLAQVPMDQLPAAPPKVTYQNGLLAIGAQNATLGDILREVHKVTGATIDIPPSGANERVVVQLGPGTPREVLASLLNGTSFNYVMLGSAADPATISSVMLSQRPSTGGEVQTAVNTPPPVETSTAFQAIPPPMPPTRMLQNMRRPPAPAQAAASDDDADDSDADDDKDDDSDQPQPQAQQPGQMVQPTLNPPPDNSNEGNQANSGPKTPEQILQMIRDRQPQPGAPPPQQPPQQ